MVAGRDWSLEDLTLLFARVLLGLAWFLDASMRDDNHSLPSQFRLTSGRWLKNVLEENESRCFAVETAEG
jgi:hypothetical protein